MNSFLNKKKNETLMRSLSHVILLADRFIFCILMSINHIKNAYNYFNFLQVVKRIYK